MNNYFNKKHRQPDSPNNQENWQSMCDNTKDQIPMSNGQNYAGNSNNTNAKNSKKFTQEPIPQKKKYYELDQVLDDFTPRVDSHVKNTSGSKLFSSINFKQTGFIVIGAIITIIIIITILNGNSDDNSKASTPDTASEMAKMAENTAPVETIADENIDDATPEPTDESTDEDNEDENKDDENKDDENKDDDSDNDSNASENNSKTSDKQSKENSSSESPNNDSSSNKNSNNSSKKSYGESILFSGNSSIGDGMKGWTIGNYEGGRSTFSNNGGTYTININSLGSQDWHVHMFQRGVQFKSGTNYRVSYTINSTTARRISTRIHETHDSWLDRVNKKFDIPANKNVKISFETGKISGDPDKFYIGLGYMDQNLPPHRVTISNVSVNPIN